MGLLPKPTSCVPPMSHVSILVEFRVRKSVIKRGLLVLANIPPLGCAQEYFPAPRKGLNKRTLEEGLQRFTRAQMAARQASESAASDPTGTSLALCAASGMVRRVWFGVSLLGLDVACVQGRLPAQAE